MSIYSLHPYTPPPHVNYPVTISSVIYKKDNILEVTGNDLNNIISINYYSDPYNVIRVDNNNLNWIYNSGNTVTISIPPDLINSIQFISITTPLGISNSQHIIFPSPTISSISGQNPLTISGTNLFNINQILYYNNTKTPIIDIVDDNPSGTSWSYENDNSIIATKPNTVTQGVWNIRIYNSWGLPSNTILNYSII